MSEKIINIVSNSNYDSRRTTSKLIQLLLDAGYTPTTKFSDEAELTVCIGGDGSFIKAVHKNNFSDIPFVGVNTGHLGFFQEISPDHLPEFVDSYKNGHYEVEEIKALGAEVFTQKKSFILNAINEVVLRADHSKIIHCNVFINRAHLEKFSGDGLLVSTPAGSTAYNFSNNGAIIHPSINVLELTPIAPVHSIAYRSLKSSVVVPGNYVISLVPERRYASSNLLLVDGEEFSFKGLKRVNLRMSGKTIKKLTFANESYWDNVKSKFL
ncbi:NAD(+)/NADH kinase [Peptoniphilus equinus]|uniref:NAD kinase n=1 Tax=Peptoniphilus equinus TaxID=3016343 RepID=A0ABY7QUY3_9FIRM|nr:NAD(+)/NADH kinase [Peptoniphilus equinus]WBW50216.1 NAD(+)/NADH kinase [Peptoniphilus equinus]